MLKHDWIHSLTVDPGDPQWRQGFRVGLGASVGRMFCPPAAPQTGLLPCARWFACGLLGWRWEPGKTISPSCLFFCSGWQPSDGHTGWTHTRLWLPGVRIAFQAPTNYWFKEAMGSFFSRLEVGSADP